MVISDYDNMGVIVKSLRGLKSQADKMIENGINLSDVKIGKGVYANFCAMVNEMKQIDESKGLGYKGKLEPFKNFETVNWSDFMVMCNKLLPIANLFRMKLQPHTRKRKFNKYTGY